jgi:hypothetical protein
VSRRAIDAMAAIIVDFVLPPDRETRSTVATT